MQLHMMFVHLIIIFKYTLSFKLDVLFFLKIMLSIVLRIGIFKHFERFFLIEFFDDSLAGIDEPVIHLADGQPRLLCHLYFFRVRWIWITEVIQQPSLHNVG
jgi:hypothetical protein